MLVVILSICEKFSERSIYSNRTVIIRQLKHNGIPGILLMHSNKTVDKNCLLHVVNCSCKIVYK